MQNLELVNLKCVTYTQPIPHSSVLKNNDMHDFLLWYQILKKKEIVGKNCTHTAEIQLMDRFDPKGIQIIAEKRVTYKIMHKKKSELSIKFVINYKKTFGDYILWSASLLTKFT